MKKETVVIVALIAAIIVLIIFLVKKFVVKPAAAPVPGAVQPITLRPDAARPIIPTDTLTKDTSSNPTLSSGSVTPPTSKIAPTPVTYENLPRDPTGQIIQGTPQLDTYCQQQAAELVWYKVKWACYLGASHGQLTGTYYTYHSKYVQAPRNNPDQAKAVAICPSGVKPGYVTASYDPLYKG